MRHAENRTARERLTIFLTAARSRKANYERQLRTLPGDVIGDRHAIDASIRSAENEIQTIEQKLADLKE